MSGYGAKNESGERVIRDAALQPVALEPKASADRTERVRRGDADAFEEVVHLHQLRLYRIALGILGNDADAKDATQQAFLRLYKHRRRLRAGEPLWPYLCRIALNVARDMARARGRLHQQQRPLEELTTEPVGSDGHELLDRLSQEQRRRLVLATLPRLRERERIAVVLRDLEGLETREVAELMETEPVTVRSHLSRGRLRLRRLLSDADRPLVRGETP